MNHAFWTEAIFGISLHRLGCKSLPVLCLRREVETCPLLTRYVFFHSIALAYLVGFLVYLQAYVFPFTKLVVH
jgi:hypothetical protein